MVSSLRSMKTPVFDNIDAELLNWGEVLIDQLLLSCQDISCYEQIPVNWKGIIITVPKKVI